MPECFLVPKSYSLFPYFFVALLNSIPTYLLNFEFFYHSSTYIAMYHRSGKILVLKFFRKVDTSMKLKCTNISLL